MVGPGIAKSEQSYSAFTSETVVAEIPPSRGAGMCYSNCLPLFHQDPSRMTSGRAKADRSPFEGGRGMLIVHKLPLLFWG